MSTGKFKITIAVTGAAALIAAITAITPAHADPGPGQPTGTPTPRPTGFPTAPAVFVAAHPDDETLAMGVPLAEHANQPTHVLILTSGGASNAIDLVNAQLAAAPLTQAEFMAAREAEATRAVHALSPNAVIHFARLTDGQVTTASAKAAILALADEIGTPALRLKGHSYSAAVEPHADHRAIGQAIVALGVEQPTRFADRRFYVLPHSWGYAGSLPGKAFDLPGTQEIADRVHLAADAYCDWSPPVSYSIGCLSVPGLFATLNATPKALVHQ